MALATAGALVTFGTTLSAVFGLGGGMIVLGTLMVLYGAKIAIPLHAVIVLAANLFRVIAFRQDIHWAIVGRYALLVVPGVYLGALVFDRIDEHFLEDALGILILLSAASILFPRFRVWPQRLNVNASAQTIGLGLASGFLGATVGATGPVVAGALLKQGLVKEALVATKSASQLILQLVKLAFFAVVIGFDFRPHTELLLVLVGCAGLGTIAGWALIHRFDSSSHKKWVTIVLIAIAAKLIIL